MIRCRSCGTLLYDAAKACYNCGTIISTGSGEPTAVVQGEVRGPGPQIRAQVETRPEFAPRHVLRAYLLPIIIGEAALLTLVLLLTAIFPDAESQASTFLVLGLALVLAGGFVAGGTNLTNRRVVFYGEGAARLGRDQMRRFAATSGLGIVLVVLGLSSIAWFALLLGMPLGTSADLLVLRVVWLSDLVILIVVALYLYASPQWRRPHASG